MAQQLRAQGTRRVWVPAAFFAAFALVILGRLIQVQILQHDRYAEAAKQELLGSDVIYARRGSILDRNGNVFATSVDTWDIYVNRRAWQNATVAKEAAAPLAKYLAMSPDQLRATVSGSESIDVLVKRDVDFETGKQILAGGVTGVVMLPNSARVHPEGDTASSILGFIGQDNTGLAGIEASYNETLQGKPGKAIYERDTAGDPIPFGQSITEEPIAGKDLVLTIDRYLQQLAEQQLAIAMEKHRAKGGAIIMMNPSTGEIIAMATWPGITFSRLASLDLSDEKQLALLKNVAVTELYEPGSVMKVVTAAAAIDAGAVTPNTSYVDNGVTYVYDIPLRNWRDGVYGPQDMTGVLINSINTGAVFMQQALEKKQPGGFQKYLHAFGFGKPTGIDLQGEPGGIIREPGEPNYSPVDLATQAFGQSISVTPIQMLTAIAAAVNGGNVIKPHLVKAIVSDNGDRQEIAPEVVGRAISSEASAKVRQMLQSVVNVSGFHPGMPKLYIAGGKSGTANVPIINGYDDTQVASFIGFAPVEDPEILVLVKLDENQDLKTGTEAAAPVFALLADAALSYLNVRPDAATFVSQR